MTEKEETIIHLIEKYGVSGADKAFLEHELELIKRRNRYQSDEPTKQQRGNERIKNTILNLMEPNEWYTATDVAKGLGGIENGVSAQKASALCSQLKEIGLLQRCTYRRKTYFALPDAVFPWEKAENVSHHKEIEDTVYYQPPKEIENSSKGKFPWLAVAGLLLASFFI